MVDPVNAYPNPRCRLGVTPPTGQTLPQCQRGLVEDGDQFGFGGPGASIRARGTGGAGACDGPTRTSTALPPRCPNTQPAATRPYQRLAKRWPSFTSWAARVTHAASAAVRISPRAMPPG